jgi:hypothetical protein
VLQSVQRRTDATPGIITLQVWSGMCCSACPRQCPSSKHVAALHLLMWWHSGAHEQCTRCFSRSGGFSGSDGGSCGGGSKRRRITGFGCDACVNLVPGTYPLCTPVSVGEASIFTCGAGVLDIAR